MPQELLNIRSGITWISAKIQPCDTGMETELYFQRDGRPFVITFDALPESGFFLQLYKMNSLTVLEFSSSDRGRREQGRYVVLLDDDNGQFNCRVECDQIRWQPISS